MPDNLLTEEPLQFGEGGRMLGILSVPKTPPRNARDLPVFVLLNAGALHRVGPARLHVRLARELARAGFSSLRVDLAGNGDTPPRAGLAYQESVAADFTEIVGVLDARLGPSPLVIGGLCSGADNSIRLAPAEPRVVGMFLLDPYCYPDAGFKFREKVQKYLDPARYVEALKRRLREMKARHGGPPAVGITGDYWTIRKLPTPEQLSATFATIRERNGRVLSVFTRYALPYYNQVGQLERTLGVEGYGRFCTERFWPWAEHTFPLELHRCRLIEEIRSWACGYLPAAAASSRMSLVPEAADEVEYPGRVAPLF